MTTAPPGARSPTAATGFPLTTSSASCARTPDRQGLLYAGGEFGVYISLDDGASWQSFQLNLPVTPVTDIQVHNQDLLLSTQGRSFWILDNLTPLHQLNDEVRAADASLTPPRDASRLNGSGGFSLPGGRRATDAPNGIIFDYHLGDGHDGAITLAIKDSAGETVRELTSEPPPGPARPIPEIFLILAETFGLDIGGKPLGKSAGAQPLSSGTCRLDAPRPPKGSHDLRLPQSGALMAAPGTYEVDP